MISDRLKRLMGGRGEEPLARLEPSMPRAPEYPAMSRTTERPANEPGEPPVVPAVAPPLPHARPNSSHEIGQLMTAISDQSNELQTEFAKISNWSVQLDLLMTRTATMQQVLPKFVQMAQDQAAQIEELSGIRGQQDREISGLRIELEHYRPLAIRYEEELHRSRASLDKTQDQLTGLETEYGKLQGECNGLLQKLSGSDSRIQRLTEERQVVEQKLLEKSASTQNLSREVAILRSDLVASNGENQRLQRDLSSLTEKMVGDREDANEAATEAQARIVQALQTIRELEAQAAAAAERERKLNEDVAQRDKKLYDLDIKISALNSKSDFLTGVNQQLRSDLRHHIDHVGTLEHSNRQLIEAMSRNRQAIEARAPEGYEAEPKLKVASQSE